MTKDYFRLIYTVAKIKLSIVVLFALFIGACNKAEEPDGGYDNLAINRAQKQLDQFFTEERLNYFNSEGLWIGNEQWAFQRSLEPLTYCQTAFASGNEKAISQANNYLENFPDYHQEWHRSSYFLAKYTHLMSAKSIEKLSAHMDEIADGFLEDHWNFVGCNDNFPCMATCGNILYGERTGNQLHLKKGIERLEEFKALLTRNGVNSEFSSQAYCFIQIEPIAMIAELTTDEEIRKLALEIEERLWIDVLGHYHLPSGKMAGPWSRAYQWDMHGVGLPFAMFDFVLGDLIPFVLLDDYFQVSEEWIKFRAASCYGNEYHCPQYLLDWLRNREYPFRFFATADGCASYNNKEMDLHELNTDIMTPEMDYELEPFGAWHSRIATYMTEFYSIGTSTKPFHSGNQTESFLITYPRKAPGKDFRNAATVFSRLIVNDSELLEGETDGYGDRGIVFNEGGRKLVSQHDNTAMVLYKPYRYLREKVSRVSVGIYIPNSQWGNGECTIDEIWIGDNKLKGNTGTSQKAETVFVKDGDVYMAYIPLIEKILETKKLVKVENRSGYTVVEFFNYEGAEKSFTKGEFAIMGNGFVSEIASKNEYASFEEFRKTMMHTKVTDEYRAYQHYRRNPHRYTKYERPYLVLETEYSPFDEGIRFQTYNGKNLYTPRFDVDGLTEIEVPFLE